MSQLRQNFVWRRRIRADEEELWRFNLSELGFDNVAYSEKKLNSTFGWLEAYASHKANLTKLPKHYGGHIKRLDYKKIRYAATHKKPLHVNESIIICNEPPKSAKRKKDSTKYIYIPAERAFGSGDHPTTAMILRQMGRTASWAQKTVLDIGTGSGILAIAAHALGARHITAIDVDPIAIRIAKKNERISFRSSKILWKTGNVAQLSVGRKFDVIVANLFSELLAVNARRICRCLKPGGAMFLSGILKEQAHGVARAFEKVLNRKAQKKRIGKWVMLYWK